jgi:hypothetical protein
LPITTISEINQGESLADEPAYFISITSYKERKLSLSLFNGFNPLVLYSDHMGQMIKHILGG